jgi:hypothetical protein
MKTAFLLLSACLLTGCVTRDSRTSDSRDYAITRCEIQPGEIEVAQNRARKYLSRHATEARLLAVQADSVSASEIQDLWVKLGRSETSSSAYAQWRNRCPKLWCVLIVDRSTQLPLTNQGYVLANTPARGTIAQIGARRALYIGTGS